MVCPSSSSSLPKREYGIGGWIPGNAELLFKKWKPVFETYLAESVGRLYDPPISFKLIPADFTADATSEKLIRSGTVDFVCKYFCQIRQIIAATASDDGAFSR